MAVTQCGYSCSVNIARTRQACDKCKRLVWYCLQDLNPVRSRKIPIEAYTELPNGLKYVIVAMLCTTSLWPGPAMRFEQHSLCEQVLRCEGW